jgi:hypothetical protein
MVFSLGDKTRGLSVRMWFNEENLVFNTLWQPEVVFAHIMRETGIP